MAYDGPTIAVPDSSPSSVSGHSPRDTPATKLTHISPHGTLHSQKTGTVIHDASEPPLFELQHHFQSCRFFEPASHPALLGHDPFMSQPSKASLQSDDIKQKLSATASVFEPRSPTESPNQQLEPRSSSQRPVTQPGISATAGGPSRAYQRLTAVTPVPLNVFRGPGVAAFLPGSRSDLELHFVAGPSRYIMISGLPQQCPRVYLDALLAVPVIAQSRIAVSDHIVPYGMVMLRYDDVRFAEVAFGKIRSEFPDWSSGYVPVKCWLSFVKATCEPPASELEGQVLVTITVESAHRDISLAGQEDYLASTMHSRLTVHGDIRSVSCMLATATMVALKVEFYSLAATRWPGLEEQHSSFPGLRVSVTRYGQQVPAGRMQDLEHSLHLVKTSDQAHETPFATMATDLHNSSPGKVRASVPGTIARTPRKWVPQAPRTIESPSANHNVVDVERIRRGQDVRTTIMLRNIPNKVDQPTLKDIVDETSRGRYDFMYLRIDFANNCNVGYAFINFEDSQYIIDFVEAIAGKRWNRFNSDKVAEVSYATIQGKDCLVQKFRNSSVMLEAPLFRPKIFHTGDGPLAGQEEKFPAPDNHSKMRRSLENAEHVGLFAPRVGQRFRDEQRRRRSRYDRGTRLAEIEEYGHEDNGLFQPNMLAFPQRAIAYPIFQQPAYRVYG